MTDEEYKAIVIRIGEAFKELPDDRARYDVLASLAALMEKRVKVGGLVEGWAIEATGCLKGIVRMW